MERNEAAGAEVRGEALRAGLAAFALYHVALAVWMAAAPHAFYEALGPFEVFNRHYLRDTATFNAALGVGFLVATRRPSWRVPVIAITTVQFALHTVNHLLDASKAHPQWIGWFDFGALLLATLQLAWMWRAAGSSRASGGVAQAALHPSPPLPERSTT